MDKVKKGFGTFEGVFTPTILTILGVIMYLRLGWVVGNAGIGGAILIIVLAKIVTICTGLSIASMVTNINVGAGGSYAIVSRSLGLEMGSSVGIPLYMSQAIGGAMYITGFTEAWSAIFPAHNPVIVSSAVLLGIFMVSMISAKVAMKIQYLIMAVIVASLVSFFLGKAEIDPSAIVLWGSFPKASFWVVFSIFFPAVTGIEAGAAMSGELADPKKSLKSGILMAIAISMIIYIAMAVMLGRMASTEHLTNNFTILMNISRWRFLIIAGVFGATLSSALGSIVGGPRTLMALGQDRALPFSKMFAKRGKDGEPRFSIVTTAILVQVCLMLGDLNTLAPLLTMFFLITYGTINLAVLVEQGTGISSFRPSFKLPLLVPLVGAVWSFVVMIFINPYFAVAAIVLMLSVYIIQIKRGLETPWGDVRKALFNAIAEWAAKTSARMPDSPKSWKPNIIASVENPKEWAYRSEFLNSLLFPGGTLRLLTVKIIPEQYQPHEIQEITEAPAAQPKRSFFDRFRKAGKQPETAPAPLAAEPAPAAPATVTSPAVPAAAKTGGHELSELQDQLSELSKELEGDGIFTFKLAVEGRSFVDALRTSIQVMKGMIFPPNIFFATLSPNREKDEAARKIVYTAIRENLGVIVLNQHPKASFGRMKKINVWIRQGSRNINLALLSTMRIARNWGAVITLISIGKDEQEAEKAKNRLLKIVDTARMPPETEIMTMTGEFSDIVGKAPSADLNVFGLPDNIDSETFHTISDSINTSCLFILDSGTEKLWT